MWGKFVEVNMKKLNSKILYMMIVLFFMSSIGYADPARPDTITKYYSIHTTAFDAEYHGHMWQKDYGSLWSYSMNAAFYAPVYLPDSARVIEFKAWVHDDYATHNITVSLYRVPLDTTTPYPMANVTSVAGAGDQELTDTEIGYNLIDNTAYKYCARVNLYVDDSRHALYGVRIKYEIVQENPAVNETSEQIGGEAVSMIYPMPFSQNTSINYHVPKRENVSIKIYDEAGRLVRTLIDGIMQEGTYTARWDGNDSNGRKVATGSYFCIVKTNGSSSTKVVHIQ
jgi:hypothetical protein